MNIGIISEGLTDQITIEAMVQGFFSNRNQSLEPLQPKKNESGNWDKVFKYCRSDELKQALLFNDLLIIHVDTDVLKSDGIPKELVCDFNNKTIIETIEIVKHKIIELIGDFYEENSEKFVFAISVDNIECWYLPIYFPNQKQTCNKIAGCIEKLNQALQAAEGFYINAKTPSFYQTMSKHFLNKQKLKHCLRTNESVSAFLTQLERFKQDEVYI